MKIILASLNHVPYLINGKVCVYYDVDSYKLYKPSRHTIIDQTFDPIDYSILDNGKYSCVIHSTYKEKEDYMARQAVKNILTPCPYRLGDKIHIHSRRGIYEIVRITTHSLHITCKKWQYTEAPIQIIQKKDFAALAGGLHNHNFG